MAGSIKDQVAIIGVGCTKFGDNFDQSFEDLLVEAGFAAFADARIEPERVEAAWLGTFSPYAGNGKASVSLAAKSVAPTAASPRSITTFPPPLKDASTSSTRSPPRKSTHYVKIAPTSTLSSTMSTRASKVSSTSLAPSSASPNPV